MSGLVWNIVLGFVWALATGDFTPRNYATGFGIGFVVLLFTGNAMPSARYHARLVKTLRFMLFFIWELILANLRVAHDVITPRLRARPAIIALPLEARTDEEITLLANLISLTPGTLSLDVSADRSTLYVHAMFGQDPDELRAVLKNGFERRLLEAMR